MMDVEFSGEVWHWRGPAPYHFVSLPDDHAAAIDSIAQAVTFGWGMIPVDVTLGSSRWRTSLYPKDGGYVLPLRDSVRRREGVELGGTVAVRLDVRPR